MKLLAALALAAAPALAQPAAKPFTLSSRSFRDGELLKRRYAGNNPASKNCVGENVSPALSWSNTPPGATSLVLLVGDPEGREGAGVNHFVAYGVRPELGGFKEGALSQPGPDYVGGKSTMALGYYMGPCPPAGVTPHHYTFLLFATDLAPDALPAGLAREEVVERIKGHVKGVSGLVGRFVKPNP